MIVYVTFGLILMCLGLGTTNPYCQWEYEQLGQCFGALLMQRTDANPPMDLCQFLTRSLQCVDTALKPCVNPEDIKREKESLFATMVHNPRVVKLENPEHCSIVKNGRLQSVTAMCSFEEAKNPHRRTQDCLRKLTNNVLTGNIDGPHRNALSEQQQCDLLKDAWTCIDIFLLQCASTLEDRVNYRNSNLKLFVDRLRQRGYQVHKPKSCHLLV
eukprot:maker-scaffold100_size373717-snap-gene-2.39 protein:Tk05130 transcript:maker-scaffold100_size373717-snap-gene-2.39-mRNA-1 annotation:"coiled-coil domain-containing protein 77-like"